MTLNGWRRRILWFLAMPGMVALFCLDGARAQRQSIVLVAPPPPAVTSVLAQPSASGLGTYCEWVIAIYPIGKAAASSPACVSHAGGSVTVNWPPAGVGVTGYDVLRTTSPSLPSGQWNGAVATNVACCSQTDNLGALSSYTLASAPPAQATFRLDNQVNSQPTVYLEPPFKSVAVGTTTIDPVTGINDPTAQLVPKFRLAMAKTRDGVSDTKILCVGDSTTTGMGDSTLATIPALSSYPWRLAGMLNSRLATAPGLAIGISSLSGGLDNRWTYGAGWAPGNFGFSQSTITGSSPAGSLTFTPGGGFSYDKFDVYAIQDTGYGTITATATGGTQVVTDIGVGGGPRVLKFTVTAAAAANTNAVTITETGGLVFIIAVEPYLSTAVKVRVGNAGVGSAATQQWSVGGGFGSLASIAAYAPDLTIISLGINDAKASVPATTVQANLAAIIAQAQLSGDVILMTMPPSHNAPENALEALYQPVYHALSAQFQVPIVDIYGRFGGTWQTQWMFDAWHPNNAGYWDMAGAVNALLLRVQ